MLNKVSRELHTSGEKKVRDHLSSQTLSIKHPVILGWLQDLFIPINITIYVSFDKASYSWDVKIEPAFFLLLLLLKNESRFKIIRGNKSLKTSFRRE